MYFFTYLFQGAPLLGECVCNVTLQIIDHHVSEGGGPSIITLEKEESRAQCALGT